MDKEGDPMYDGPNERIIVTGSRTWPSDAVDQIRRALVFLPRTGLIIHGGARRGVDAYTGVLCKRLGIKQEVFLVDWTEHTNNCGCPEYMDYCRTAGFRRNIRMLTETSPTGVMAFRATGTSNGTDHMIRIAVEAKLPVTIRHLNGEVSVYENGGLVNS